MAHPAPWLTWQNCNDAYTLTELANNSRYVTEVTFNDYRGTKEADFGLALGLALTNNTRVTTVNIDRKLFSDADMHFLSLALAKNSTIFRLKIADSAMGHVGVTALATALGNSSSCVESLHMSGVDMGSDGAMALAEALTSSCPATALAAHASNGHHHTPNPLTTLELPRCQFGNQGIEHLANAIARSTSLTKVSFDCCAFMSRTDAKKLISAIKTNASLTDIDLYYNYEIGKCGAELLDAIQGNTRLVRLNLRNCHVPEIYLKQIETIVSTNAISKTYAKYTSTLTAFHPPTPPPPPAAADAAAPASPSASSPTPAPSPAATAATAATAAPVSSAASPASPPPAPTNNAVNSAVPPAEDDGDWHTVQKKSKNKSKDLNKDKNKDNKRNGSSGKKRS